MIRYKLCLGSGKDDIPQQDFHVSCDSAALLAKTKISRHSPGYVMLEQLLPNECMNLWETV